MSTLTDKDLTILESLDFEPACQKSNHGSDESARWIVFYRDSYPCGRPLPTALLWCEPCRARWVSAPNGRCPDCGLLGPHLKDVVLRIEPLR